METAVRDLKGALPVVIDGDFRIIWKALANHSRCRISPMPGSAFPYQSLGGGQYVEAELVLSELPKEGGARGLDESVLQVVPEGVEAAPSVNPPTGSPERAMGCRTPRIVP